MMTVNEIANKFNVSQRTIYRWLENGKLPFAFKFFGEWRFKEEEVENWIEKRKKK